MKPNRPKKHARPALSSPFVGPPHVAAAAATARSRSLHWLAWGGAVVSLSIAAVWTWASPQPRYETLLQGIDVGLALFFAAEFFTRTGWQRSRLTYLKWRWFDVVAILPVTVLGPVAVAPLIWFVLVCRAIRLVDRTLGDGYVQRKAIAAASMVEEEISDRVLVKMLARWERELEGANFGTAMAQALSRNKQAVLERVYSEQLREGTFAKFAHYSGLQAALEKEESRLFSAFIEMVGSREVDAAIRDVIGSSLRRSREQLGAKDWRHGRSTLPPPVAGRSSIRPAAAAPA